MDFRLGSNSILATYTGRRDAAFFIAKYAIPQITHPT